MARLARENVFRGVARRVVIGVLGATLGFSAASYAGYSASPTSTSSGGGTWGAILSMSAGVSGTQATFTVTKQSGSFSSAGTMYLKEGSITGTNRASASVLAGAPAAPPLSLNLSSLSGYPKSFYARYESSIGGYAWVGPITISFVNHAPGSPAISSSPASIKLGLPVSISVTRGSDSDGDRVKVQCTAIDSDRTTQSPYDSGLGTAGTTVTPSFVFSVAGTKTIYCTSFDEYGTASSTSQRTISVTVNQLPSAPVISNSPATAYRGASVDVAVTRGTDPDGDSVKVQCTAIDSNRTDASPYISSFSTGGTATTASFVFNLVGTKTIYCASFDNSGVPSATASRTMQVNDPTPSGSLTSPSGSVTGPVTVVASATAPLGLHKVSVVFAPLGIPYALCEDGTSRACPATSGTWNEPGVDPRWYSATPGTLSVGLWVLDDVSSAGVLVNQRTVTWQPAATGTISSPSGSGAGLITVAASATAAAGLKKVSVVFVPYGTPLVLCEDATTKPCPASASGSWSQAGVNPRDYSVTGASALTVGLWVADDQGRVENVFQQPYQWAPAGTGAFSSPSGAVTGPIRITASASAPSGLKKVSVVFVVGGPSFVLCEDGTSNPCPAGTSSGQWDRSAIDPRTYGVTGPGTVTLGLWILDDQNHTDLVASQAFPWQPAQSVFNDLPADHWAYPAALYLFQHGLLQPDANGNIRPFDSVKRAELAKLAFLGAGIPPLADNFPTPFNDLQDLNAQTEWYYSYAKNLSYLEFGDGVPPFTRDRFNFYPADPITRAHTLKVLIESWNMALETGSVPYNDVPASHDSYRYVYTAYTRGLIDAQQASFRPDDSALRAETFVMLYNLMAVRHVPAPSVSRQDFFSAGNYTPANLGLRRSLVNGNFRHYTRTSFSIPGARLPLLFAHTYNSYLTELPDQLFPLRPFGHGWSHTFNSYLMPIDQNLIVYWPDGVLHVYRLEGTGAVPVTKGVYDTLTRVSSTQYTIQKKNQIVFTYEKLAGTSADFPFVLTRVTDPNGNSLALSYETAVRSGWLRLQKVTDSAGRMLTFSYHPGSDLIRDVTDPLSRRISFDYDAYSADADLVLFKDAKQQVTRYAYNTATPARHLLRTMTLPRGNTITNTYDERKLRSTQQGTRPAVQLSYQRNYDQPGNAGYVVTNLTAAGRSFTLSTSRAGTADSVTGPAGFTATYQYNDALNPTLPTRIVGADGVQLDLTYDSRGNVQRVDRPLGVTEQFVYTGRNSIRQYTDPRGKITRFDYDARGNLIGVTDPLSRSTTFAWDARGLLTSVTNPASVTQSFSYDAYGNRIHTSAPLGITSSATYDTAGRLLTATDPRGFVKRYAYDANDNRISTTDLFTTTIGYDGNDNLTTVTNAKGGVTTWSYNPEDLLEAMDFAGARTSYAYYEDGLLSQRTDPDGQSTSYQYDDLGRLAGDNHGNLYKYDSRGNLISASNNLGELKFTYDALDRLSSHSDMYGNIINYAYDAASNVIGVTYPGNKTVQYEFADDGRLRTVIDWLGGRTTYSYDINGDLAEILNANGVIARYTYDLARRLTTLLIEGADGTIASYAFELDAAANQVHVTGVEPLPSIPLRSELVALSYDGANRIVRSGDIIFTSDPNGNTTSKGGRSFVFDSQGLILEVRDSSLLRYAYDALGHCRSTERDGIVRRSVLDLTHQGGQILMETDDRGAPVSYFIYGMGLIYRLMPNGETSFFHYDFRGSTVAITDATQRVTHKYAYGPYGEVLSSMEESANRFLYLGRYGVTHEGDGLYHMGLRFYDSKIGRFLSQDEKWSVNRYPYADDNPVMKVDPTGLWPFDGNELFGPYVMTPEGQARAIFDLGLRESGSSVEEIELTLNRVNSRKELDEKLRKGREVAKVIRGALWDAVDLAGKFFKTAEHFTRYFEPFAVWEFACSVAPMQGFCPTQKFSCKDYPGGCA